MAAGQDPPDFPGGALPQLPTQQCPHCANITPVGGYCGVCGAHLVHPESKVATRRSHSFLANPDEPVLRLSVISSLFPHLSHRSSVPFRTGFALLAGLLVVFSATDLEAPVIALSAMGVPLLFQLYIYEVDLYEDSHLRLAAETLTIGAALGFGWALLGGHVVAHALQPTLGSSLTGYDVIEAAIVVPVVGQALMLVPLLLVLVLVPGFGGRRESLDGFALGAASALGFTFAAVITELANRLSAGLVPARSFTSILTEALVRGVCQPVIAAAATGLVGASVWVRRSEKGAVAAGGRWLTDPLVILAAVLSVEVGLGFADQARLADIPLLGVHLAATALMLVALRAGLHHILLHEQHDVAIGPAYRCPHCNHVVPLMPFCPACGVAQVATTKRQRRHLAPEGWPTLSPEAGAAAWSGYPMATVPAPRSHRRHHSLLVAVFASGLAATIVALVLTAVFEQPNTTPVQRCPDGLCPGVARLGAGDAGSPEPSGFQTFSAKDGRFDVALVGSGLYSTSLGPQSNSSVSLVYQPSSVQVDGQHLRLAGGEVQFADFTNSSGMNAEQVVNGLVSANAPSASLVYPLSDPLVGYEPGYGAVYDVNVNSSSGTQQEYRLLVMAAIEDNVAVVVWADGPDDASFASLPLLDHPSFIDMDIALAGLDVMINSVTWRQAGLGP